MISLLFNKLYSFWFKSTRALGIYYVLTIITIPSVLTTIWFKNKNILMAAEEGPIFFNPANTFKLYSHVWTDSGLGIANPLITPRIPFYAFLTLLSNLNLPPYLIQQFVFFVLILIPLLSIPHLVALYFPTKYNVGKIAAIFYTLNLYVQAQVWHRFLFPQIFLWSYLPLFLLIWGVYLKTFKFRYCTYLVVTSFLFSLMFSFVSTVLALWIPASVICISQILISKSKKNIIKIILYGSFAFLIWILGNMWWIIPLTVAKDNNYSALIDSNKNLDSLIEVSKYYTNKNIFLLRHAYYFGQNPVWGKYLYNNYIPWAIVAIVIMGTISQLKSRGGKIFFLLFLVGWFLSKGANPPFGTDFFHYLFSIFPPTQVLRNPYEKLGVIFLLAYSIFFGHGIMLKFGNRLRILFIILFCWWAVRPIWDGSVFTGYSVSVPESYNQINNILEESQAHRGLSMPFLHTANVSYEWGYKGEELSELFFVKPILSRTYNAPNDIYPHLYQFTDKKMFSNLFPILAIDYVILHKDMLDNPGIQESVLGAESYINNWNDMSEIIDTKELKLFRYVGNKNINWVYAANKIHEAKSTSEGFSRIVNNTINPYNEAFIDSYSPDLLIDTNSKPNLKVNKISSHQYFINVNNATDRYSLVLSTQYNPNWIAKINGKAVEKHFKINGYANGWIVENNGSYTIELIYKMWPWEK